MGGSSERLIASPKGTQSYWHSEESPSPPPAGEFIFVPRACGTMERGSASSWLFLEHLYHRKGRPCPAFSRGASLELCSQARLRAARSARPAGGPAAREAKHAQASARHNSLPSRSVTPLKAMHDHIFPKPVRFHLPTLTPSLCSMGRPRRAALAARPWRARSEAQLGLGGPRAGRRLPRHRP